VRELLSIDLAGAMLPRPFHLLFFTELLGRGLLGNLELPVTQLSEVRPLLCGEVKSYAQEMEHQDNQPSDNPTDRTDEYGEQIEGYIVSKNKVTQEQEDQPHDPVDDELAHKTPASRQHEQDHYYHQYEYSEFHRSSFYTTCRAVRA
jgi:hypothetical protein